MIKKRNMITGKYRIFRDRGILKNNKNARKTIDSKKLMSSAVIHPEITRISRGKYTFFTSWGLPAIIMRQAVVDRVKKLHIMIPWRRKSW
jgi:hypothetical protein